MRFNVGDKVRIVDNVWGHGFDEDEIVTIIEVDEREQSYTATAENDTINFFLCDEEIEEVIE